MSSSKAHDRFVCMKWRSVMAAGITLAASSAFAIPLNDSFADRLDLGTVLPATAEGDATGSTFEPLEPDDFPCARAGSLWWSWSAPADGWIEVNAAGSAIDASVAVYAGDAVESLDLPRINGRRHGATTFRKRVHFFASAGSTYQIALIARESGMARLNILPIPPPPDNDDFANRVRLEGTLPLEDHATLRGGTTESADPVIVEGVVPTRTFWWEWLAPHAGIFEFTYEVDDFGYSGSDIGIFRGDSLESLTRVAGARTYWGTTVPGAAPIYATVAAGEFLQLVVDAGDFPVVLRIREMQPPPNDHPEGAEVLDGPLPLTASGNTILATAGEGEPGWSEELPYPSVWWAWTSPTAGSFAVSATDNAFVQAFTGSDSSSLSLLPASQLGWVTFFSDSAGERFWFRVFGPRGPVGLTLREVGLEPPAFEGAHVEATIAWNSGTSKLKWRAPRSGRFLFSAEDNALIKIDGSGATGAPSPGPIVQDVKAGDLFTVTFTGGPPANFTFRAYIDFVPELLAIGNDDFADAFVLPGTMNDISVSSMANTTIEPEELLEPVQTGPHSVWWKWTAPTSGPVDVETGRYTNPGQLTVYSGDSLPELTPASSLYGHHGARLSFWAEAGTSYHFQFATWWSNPCWLCVRPGAMARHSTPAEAFDLGSQWNVRGRASPISAGNCAPVWCQWTAPAAGFITINNQVVTPGFYPYPVEQLSVALYREESPGVLSADPAAPLNEFPDFFRYPVAAGETCWVVTECAPGSPPRYMSLEILTANAEPVANDAFADRLPLTWTMADGHFQSKYVHVRHFSWDRAGTLEWATLEPGELSYATRAPRTDSPAYNRSTWWTFTAPATGVFSIEQPSDDEVPFLAALFTGDSIDSLETAALRPVKVGHLAYLPLRQGRTYALATVTADPYAGFSFSLKGPYHHESYDDWILSFPFSRTADDAPDANPSNDGIPNLVKWALDLDPTQNSLPGGGDPNHANAPVLVENAEFLELRFRRSATAPSPMLHLWGQQSSDLLNWGAGSELEPISLGGGYYAVRARKISTPVFLRLFLRLNSNSASEASP